MIVIYYFNREVSFLVAIHVSLNQSEMRQSPYGPQLSRQTRKGMVEANEGELVVSQSPGDRIDRAEIDAIEVILKGNHIAAGLGNCAIRYGLVYVYVILEIRVEVTCPAIEEISPLSAKQEIRSFTPDEVIVAVETEEYVGRITCLDAIREGIAEYAIAAASCPNIFEA